MMIYNYVNIVKNSMYNQHLNTLNFELNFKVANDSPMNLQQQIYWFCVYTCLNSTGNKCGTENLDELSKL